MDDLTADLLVRSTGPRCPSCAATVNVGAPWCTLCYADLRPKPAPVAAAPLPVPPSATYGVPALDPLTAPAEALGLPAAPIVPSAVPVAEATWPCTTCGSSNVLTHDACASCGAGFLAGLRESEEPLLVLPVVGDLGALSRAQRLGLAAGVVLAVLVLVAALGLLLG